MIVLVTGVNGFVGHHLTRELAERGHTVFGLGQQDELSRNLGGIVARYYKTDLTDKRQVEQLPLEVFDSIINLAGLANVGASFNNPERYMNVNVGVVSALGEVLLNKNPDCRILAISTGAVYYSNQPLPLTEKSRLVISGSPYSLSKVSMEKTVYELSEKGLNCIIARPFNHFGPGQTIGFLLPDLKEKIIQASKSDGIINVGDLSTRRDYTDVRDVAKAYADLASSQSLEHNLFNICSGTSRSGQEILNQVLAGMGLTDKIKIETDHSLVRPNDPRELYGSYARIAEETGWQPSISFEQSVRDFIES